MTHRHATRTALRTSLRTGIAATASTLLVTGLLAATSAPATARKSPSSQINHTSFDTQADFARGKARSAVVQKKGHVKLKRRPTMKRTIGKKQYDAGTWTSPWVKEKFSYDELIPSWQATTRGDSIVQVRVRVRDAAGRVGTWDTVARWTSSNTTYNRQSLGPQPDSLSRVATDTVRTTSAAGATAWQVRVILLRRTGTKARPSVQRIGAVASRVAVRTATSKPGKAAGTVLDVPRYSQMVHRGHYPQYGNGGQAWCSPTSLAMVLEYYGVNPAAGRSFAGKRHSDGIVDFTAQQTYDHRYRGTGNWAFNTAYAGTLLPTTYVTRLPGLAATEKFIRAGTPLIVSISFGKGQLRGAPISSTNGHLVVLVGFDAAGNPVVNDPAAPTNATVRRTYDRAQFEQAWQRRSGGLTYVLED